MGFFEWKLAPVKIVTAIPEGDCELGTILLEMALKSVRCEYGSNFTTTIHTLENDSGFFQDVFAVFKGSGYTELRDSDGVTFVQSVVGVSILAGVYACFCANSAQKSLYSNYPKVKRRFFEMGPIACFKNFIRSTNCFETEMAKITFVSAPIIGYVWRQECDLICHSEDKLMALTKAMYDTGITIGAYYI